MPFRHIVAHRGYALRYPENTLAAVRGAIEQGVLLVEIDVQLSAAGTPYLFHDRDARRMTGDPAQFMDLDDGRIAALRASEPRRFGAAFAEEPVARLAALAELLAAHPQVECFVEAKGESIEVFGPRRMLEALLEALGPAGERWILISFDLSVLEAARLRGQPARLGPVIEHWAQLGDERVRALRPEFVFCDRRELPRSGPLDVAHELGLEEGCSKLVVYEVTDPREARALLARGAFAVETFQPAELAAGLGELA
jgi:glycerophosphoryl diester phosphodiesterase